MKALFYTVFLLVLAVIAVFVLQFVFRKKQVSRLVYKREFSERGVYEGDTVILTETVYNPTALPLLRIDIESYLTSDLHIQGFRSVRGKDMQLLTTRFNLLPFMQIKRTHVLTCTKRGHYRVESVSVFASREPIYLDSFAELFVYPKPLPFSQTVNPLNTVQGESRTKLNIIPDTFSMAGIRDYMTGDPFNSVNFKATARTGGTVLKVNSRDFCSSRIIMIFMNFISQSNTYTQALDYNSVIEKALSFSASIIEEALYSGYKVGFAANCCLSTGEQKLVFSITGGISAMEAILEELAKIRAKSGISFLKLLSEWDDIGVSGAEIYVFSPYVDDEIYEAAEIMGKNNNSVSVITP